MNNHKEKVVHEEKLDDAFYRLTNFQKKDIESVSVQIDEVNIGILSVKGIRIHLNAISRILIFALLAIVLLMFY